MLRVLRSARRSGSDASHLLLFTATETKEESVWEENEQGREARQAEETRNPPTAPASSAPVELVLPMHRGSASHTTQEGGGRASNRGADDSFEADFLSFLEGLLREFDSSAASFVASAL